MNIVAGFYDAATQFSTWDAAIRQLGILFDIQGTILEQHDIESGGLLEFEATGLPVEALRDWADYYHGICPRLKYLRKQPAGTIGFDHKILEPSVLRRHPLYQDFLRPYDTQYFLSATLEHDTKRYTTVSMQRTFNQGHADQRDIELLKLLIKPMQHAFRLKNQLMLDRQKQADYESVFHELNTGIVIVDTKCRVEFINCYADSIVSKEGHASIRNGFLSFVNLCANRLLRNALARLSSESSYDYHDYVCLSHSATDPLPIRIDILSIPKESRFTLGLNNHLPASRRLLIVLSDPARKKDPPEKLLRVFFSLTPMEARLALAVARGSKLKEYADENGVSLNTVRTHLANLRQKMGARDIADVTRLVSRLSQPLFE